MSRGRAKVEDSGGKERILRIKEQTDSPSKEVYSSLILNHHGTTLPVVIFGGFRFLMPYESHLLFHEAV